MGGTHKLLDDVGRNPVPAGNVVDKRPVFLAVGTVYPLEQRDRPVVADRPGCRGGPGALVEKQGLPANQNDHQGGESNKSQTMMEYCRQSSKLVQQVLPQYDNVHGTCPALPCPEFRR